VRQLWGGNPAKFIRKLDDDEITENVQAAEAYHGLAMQHENEFEPYGTAYLDAEKVRWVCVCGWVW
jgi:carbonic anhydrase/acetyltransferase-like protein (isoleucine patch superfamily)